MNDLNANKMKQRFAVQCTTGVIQNKGFIIVQKCWSNPKTICWILSSCNLCLMSKDRTNKLQWIKYIITSFYTAALNEVGTDCCKVHYKNNLRKDLFVTITMAFTTTTKDYRFLNAFVCFFGPTLICVIDLSNDWVRIRNQCYLHRL